MKCAVLSVLLIIKVTDLNYDLLPRPLNFISPSAKAGGSCGTHTSVITRKAQYHFCHEEPQNFQGHHHFLTSEVLTTLGPFYTKYCEDNIN